MCHERGGRHVEQLAVHGDLLPEGAIVRDDGRWIDVAQVKVPCRVAHGVLKNIDVAAAREVAGVWAVVTAGEVPGHNRFGPVVKDEALIVEDEAVFLGQPIAIVAAENWEALEAGRRAVVATVDPLPAMFSIDEAIAALSFFGEPRRIGRGEVDAAMAGAGHVIEGVLEIGGQEHFYLESQIAIAVPGEQGQMVIHSSTQHPSEVQMLVAEALGVPFNHVVCICKRMGGGFGGKETQAAQPAMMAAILAKKTNRPVRFVYSKDDDMRYTGKRHPFKAIYKIGFDDDGVMQAVDVQLFSNGGCSTDLSFAVLERAMLHLDNAYFLPNVKIVGRVCRTNFPSNTAFRGFGGPQGIAVIENAIEEIATKLGIDAVEVRRRNCYAGEGKQTTPYGQLVRNNTLPRLFAELVESSDYVGRRKQIGEFNETSAMALRGMAMSAVKFGISFTRRAMNQANALVNVYQDGSVIVSTGATEMGQGVFTRVRQIVADELGVHYDRVVTAATATDKNNNTSPTAASSGTDLNGAAAADACVRIRERLAVVAAVMLAKPAEGLAAEPARVRFAEDRVWDERMPGNVLSFAAVVCQAFEQRVSLGERGFYATPGVDFNRDTGKGSPFLYFTNGVACSEVEVDRFTGELKVLRIDLLMDVGKPLNPGIDRGQIIGGFVQGMGWVTGEELVYGSGGQLLSCSPTTYKIPAATDVPADFRVSFLDNPDNDVSLKRSKAVGEPPLVLGLSVWLAAKDAVRAAGGELRRMPATGERILLAMEKDAVETVVTDGVAAGV